MLSNLLIILFEIVFAYCLICIGYLFVLSLSARFFFRHPADLLSSKSDEFRSIAILVPAYKEDFIIVATAENLINLDYPASCFDVFVIADSFQTETLEALKQLPVKVIEVNFEKSTKTKALNTAFSVISKEYDIALICDADNMLKKDFLQIINCHFLNGAKAVQGRRVAKNVDTSFAILDACSEGINNNIFRKGANAIGLSSPIIGSGMAFDFKLVKTILSKINAVGGFDKILQLEVISLGETIIYSEDAIAFDEKVESSDAFRQQRKRWISSQFIYLKEFFPQAAKKLFAGNFSYFNLAVVANLILPRAFFLFLLPILLIFSIFISKYLFMASAILLTIYILTLFIALPPELINKKLFRSVLYIPKAILIMMGTLLHIRKANKTFIHTAHTKTGISNTFYRNSSE